MVSLWQIMSTFMKVGGFTLGGGYAMLPMIEREVIDRRGWVERQEVLDIYAMAQSMPGAIAINSAMFIGYRLREFPCCCCSNWHDYTVFPSHFVDRAGFPECRTIPSW